LNTRWIERTRKALNDDENSRAILATLRQMPPGRTHAGLRVNWGKTLAFGDLRFSDLLTFNRIGAISPPYSGISLNADLIWHFDDRNPEHYKLFNVKYLVAPRSLQVPSFLRPIKETPRYILYESQAAGYADFVAVAGRRNPPSQRALFFQNRDWFQGPDSGAERFVRYEYPARDGAVVAETAKSIPTKEPACRGGTILEERVLPGRIDLRTECSTASSIALKMTYHPNWRITVDGRDVPTFMISPSFIGFDLPAGAHEIRAEYRAGALKTVLVIVGAGALLALICLRSRLAEFDARFSKERN
jgi:Bacterial membrane protein YfhO